MSVDELRAIAKEAVALDGSRPTDVVAADVLPHLDSDDRNVRVAALRVLAWCDPEDDGVVDGLLRALDDPMKRVREVAAKSCPRFVGDPRIVARLERALAEDDRGAGNPALQVLGGMYGSPQGLGTFEPVAGALAAALDHPRHRQWALVALLRARALTPEVVDLLRRFVRDGSKDEAVFATRRLDGFRIERRELIGDDQPSERAFGQVWYWVRADD